MTSRLLDPLEILLRSATLLEPPRARIRQDAEMWTAQLLGADGDLAGQVAIRLVAVLDLINSRSRGNRR